METYVFKDKSDTPIGSITFNPYDFGLIFRSVDFQKRIEEIAEHLDRQAIKADGTGKNKHSAAVLELAERQLYEALDAYLQSEGSCAELFKKRRPFASTRGRFFCTQVIDEIVAYVLRRTEEELSRFCTEYPELHNEGQPLANDNTEKWREISEEN